MIYNIHLKFLLYKTRTASLDKYIVLEIRRVYIET